MHQEASITGVFEVLFWIILVSFIVRFIAALAVPFVVKKGAEQISQRMEEMRKAKEPARKDGDVTIEKPGSSSRGTDNQSGDYVDFVEIKD